jgi:predicted DNA-binding transcriptional regulator AlpA
MNNRFDHHLPEKNLQLAGLISFGGRSRSIFYQMLFTEHHPDICSMGPTERWIEHAAWRFSHDISNECNLFTGISGSFLREYATHAVRDYIVDRMNWILGWDTHLRIFPTLDTVLGISRTIEEGAFPRG